MNFASRYLTKIEPLVMQTAFPAATVANAILRKSFREKLYLNKSMLMYIILVADSIHVNRTGMRLISEVPEGNIITSLAYYYGSTPDHECIEKYITSAGRGLCPIAYVPEERPLVYDAINTAWSQYKSTLQ